MWGKTAHGLVRFTKRYEVFGVVDHTLSGQDALLYLDNKPSGIMIYEDIGSAVKRAKELKNPITHLVFGVAPDGGRLTVQVRKDILHAISLGLNVDCGLHYFLSEDEEMKQAASLHGVTIRDIRKIPPREELHGFTGRIKEVSSFRVALLGTDSCVGKRTTAWKIIEALETSGIKGEMIGTGQTAWLQGARYGVRMDSLINDFVAGEIENAILEAWDNEKPAIMIIEGQGSLMNPLYPGGFEILSAGQPDVIIMQHAPKRVEYDGIPGAAIHPLSIQIQAAELLSGKRVIAITINHEELDPSDIKKVCTKIEEETHLLTIDPLLQDMKPIVELLISMMKEKRGTR
ncbi:MAG: DUF1611 domain-containing protein [Spirochaetia bacterium]|nr:DUF1611 domain-containing protein [Spirochaetia bacterium]